jgi:hypothetical protein
LTSGSSTIISADGGSMLLKASGTVSGNSVFSFNMTRGPGKKHANLTVNVEGANVLLISTGSSGIASDGPYVTGYTANSPGCLEYASQTTNADFAECSDDVVGFQNIDYLTGNPITTYAAGAPTDSLTIDSSGNIGIDTPTPGDTLEVNGGVQIDGVANCSTALQTDINGHVVCAPSDSRLKSDVQPLDSSGAIIDRLSPHYWIYKDAKNRGSQQHAGFIADEVAAVFPQAAVPAGYEVTRDPKPVWHEPRTYYTRMRRNGALELVKRTKAGYWQVAPASRGVALKGVDSVALNAILWAEVKDLRRRLAALESKQSK